MQDSCSMRAGSQRLAEREKMTAILLYRLSTMVMLSGLCVAVWAYSRSDKSGYIFVAIFFVLTLAVFLYTGPIRSEPVDSELRAKIDQTITEYLQTESAGSAIEVHRVKVSYSVIPSLLYLIASVTLVAGLWLLGRADAKEDTETAAQQE